MRASGDSLQCWCWPVAPSWSSGTGSSAPAWAHCSSDPAVSTCLFTVCKKYHTLHQLRRRRGGKVTEWGDVWGHYQRALLRKAGAGETINPASTSQADHWLCSQQARWVITGIIPPSRNPVINTLCIGHMRLLSSVNWRTCQAHLSSATESGHLCEKRSLQLLSMSRRRQIFHPSAQMWCRWTL